MEVNAGDAGLQSTESWAWVWFRREGALPRMCLLCIYPAGFVSWLSENARQGLGSVRIPVEGRKSRA